MDRYKIFVILGIMALYGLAGCSVKVADARTAKLPKHLGGNK